MLSSAAGLWLLANWESLGGSHGTSRLGGPWWKCISVSREIQAAAGSFDYVRLAPHSAQDDRHVGCERAQGVRRSINFRWRESRQLAPRRSMAEMYSVSREIQAAAWSFDYVRPAPRSAQDDRHVGCERVQGVRKSINFRPSNSPPKRSLDGAPVYGHLTGARDGGPCDRRPGA